MTVRLTEGPDLLVLQTITRNLRQADRDECFATCWTEDPDDLANRVNAAGTSQWIVWKDEDPVASVGATCTWPGVWSCWAFGTDRWSQAALSITKHIRRVLIPALYVSHAQRVHCFASDEHPDAGRWLQSMGARQGEKLDFWGKNGQTFRCYWWDRPSVRDNPALSRHLPAGSRESD